MSNVKGQIAKVKLLASLLLLCGLIWSCSEEESPTAPGRTFSGITQRDEWGDTLAVDSTDWVIVDGPLGGSGNGPAVLPCYRNGKLIGQRAISGGADLPGFSIGAFPNPFIPQGGQLLIDLVLPQQVNVNLHLENETGDIDLTLLDTTMPMGIHTVSWNGEDSSGQRLPDGIYRIFFSAAVVTSFGDVEVNQSDPPDPPTNADYVLFAQAHYDTAQYADWEYSVATQFGPDGELSGNDGYALPMSTWQMLDYAQKFAYLPVFMNYDLGAAGSYQYHYLLAYKHFQFGAGWPDDQDYGVADSTLAWWQKGNLDHDDYVALFEGGQ